LFHINRQWALNTTYHMWFLDDHRRTRQILDTAGVWVDTAASARGSLW
jgi:hypothetical protein